MKNICLIAALIGTMAWTEPAEAQGGLAGLGEGIAIVLGIGGGVLIGVPTLAFTVGDIVSFSANTPFSTGWAVVETISAGFAIITGGVFLVLGIADLLTADPNGIFFGLSVPILALGGFNLAHAIWSFVNHGNTEPPPITASIVPQRDGVLATFGGAF